jgi:ferredoxin/flavodoxin---NADP+ reductase
MAGKCDEQFNQESVLSVDHWTDTLFSFTTTRDPSFRFRNGEFTMIGLKVGEKPLLRVRITGRCS